MNSVDHGLNHLAVARATLLTPFGLDESDLVRTLGEVFEHKVDYADLYFQFTRSEGWSLEEGIVKSGSFSIDQGVGIRAVVGDKTAFAYSDEINAQALRSAAKATRTIKSGEFTRIVNRLGGRHNALTTHDTTTYFQRVAKEHLRRCNSSAKSGDLAARSGHLPQRKPATRAACSWITRELLFNSSPAGLPSTTLAGVDQTGSRGQPLQPAL